ncbi:hypothetical protein RND71_039215 [Anisodus tanguticus]|uniref:Uncharacterized protein n=1 Tax=Anisodus tanguticus TaxID=243964 RepID=A0AAE1QWX3_9SOLA|nr:hypothetical protein RND71_039215 [Anisodus tanguticus]
MREIEFLISRLPQFWLKIVKFSSRLKIFKPRIKNLNFKCKNKTKIEFLISRLKLFQTPNQESHVRSPLVSHYTLFISSLNQPRHFNFKITSILGENSEI